MQKSKYDLIIIGAGAAGLTTAYYAKKGNSSLNILIIDRMSEPAKKILIAGAGRCNISNINLKNKPAGYYYGGVKDFKNKVFSAFGYKEITKFFDELGINTYVDKKDDRGKIFPITNHSATVRDILFENTQLSGVDFSFNTTCENIGKNENGFIISATLDGKSVVYTTQKLVLATGGKSYPILGANGSGYKFAEKFGHTIIKPVPVAVPLVAKNPLSQKLQGVHMTAEVTAIISGKDVESVRDEMVFTNYGFSGPAILDISRHFSLAIHRNNITDTFIKFDFVPHLTEQQLKSELEKRWVNKEKSVASSLYGLFLNKFCIRFLEYISIDPNKPVKMLDKDEEVKIISSLKKIKIKVYDTKSWEVAEFTSGGVSVKEVDVSSMGSKIIKNLYFVGEILDVDGKIGGYNLSWAWATGAIAGQLK